MPDFKRESPHGDFEQVEVHQKADMNICITDAQVDEIQAKTTTLITNMLDNTGIQYGIFIRTKDRTCGRVLGSVQASIDIAASAIHSALEGMKWLPVDQQAQAAAYLTKVIIDVVKDQKG